MKAMRRRAQAKYRRVLGQWTSEARLMKVRAKRMWPRRKSERARRKKACSEATAL